MLETGVSLRSVTGNDASFDQVCNELYWAAEQRLIMHKLARDYYGFRAFWVQSLPQLIATSFITIIGFLQYAQYVAAATADYEHIRQYLALSLSVAILGLFSTFLSALSITTRYQSQHDLHACAERTLAKICQSVRFPERIPGDTHGAILVQNINKQKAIFASIIQTNGADIPVKIIQAFRDLEHEMYAGKSYTFRAIQYERFYDRLWKIFTKQQKVCFGLVNLWPLRIPNVELSKTKLGEMITKEYEQFERGMEEVERKKQLRESLRSNSNMSSSRLSRGSSISATTRNMSCSPSRSPSSRSISTRNQSCSRSRSSCSPSRSPGSGRSISFGDEVTSTPQLPLRGIRRDPSEATRSSISRSPSTRSRCSVDCDEDEESVRLMNSSVTMDTSVEV